MTRLLVSVRSAAEAEIALEGGAALIDVKEPSRGALGMAPRRTIAEVLRTVAGRVPVSAALGELLDMSLLPPLGDGLAFVKCGLAGCLVRDPAAWENDLASLLWQLTQGPSACQLVVASYADWQPARAPAPEAVCRFACAHRARAFLLDTWSKNGSTLLDWLSRDKIAECRERCHAAGVPVAFAGSLGPRQIRELLPLRPDWIAVRGAACRGGRRESTVDLDKVRALAELVGDRVSATPAG